MKQIQQHNIDKVIRLTRKYRETGDTYLLPAKIEAAREVSCEMFCTDRSWLEVSEFVGGIIGVCGLSIGASNKVIYDALRCIGYEVIEPKQEGADGQP